MPKLLLDLDDTARLFTLGVNYEMHSILSGGRIIGCDIEPVVDCDLPPQFEGVLEEDYKRILPEAKITEDAKSALMRFFQNALGMFARVHVSRTKYIVSGNAACREFDDLVMRCGWTPDFGLYHASIYFNPEPVNEILNKFDEVATASTRLAALALKNPLIERVYLFSRSWQDANMRQKLIQQGIELVNDDRKAVTRLYVVDDLYHLVNLRTALQKPEQKVEQADADPADEATDHRED